MSLGTCMSCFADSVKIYNVKNTYLQSVYEIITDFKVRDDSHSFCCYCYTRLKQCYLMLKQIKIQEKCQQDNNTDAEIPPYIHLSMENMENTTTPYHCVTVKQEPNQDLDDIGDDAVKYHKRDWKKSNQLQKNKMKPTTKKKKAKDGTTKILYSCDTCDKQFTILSKLKRHQSTHLEQSQYICNICNEKFSLYANLVRHKRAHSGVKPYTCDVCSRKFKRSDHLKSHKMSHTGDRPYSCEICNMSFIRKDHLKTHHVTHTNEKPYSCNICNKAFAARYNLKIHKMTHDSNKTYICEICNKEFYRSSNLKLHQLVHSGKKPYSCNICDKAFIRKDHLYSHKERIHNYRNNDVN